MRLHKLLVLLSLTLMACAGVKAQKKVSILGDSYSTYGGYVSPETNLCWYNGTDRAPGRNNDVDSVEQTWWYQLIDSDDDLVLERNNSYSGATVCCTGYRNEDFSDRAFISRVNNLGNPDIIIVLGGTNDSWAKSPVGEYKYSGWNKQDLMSFRPAFAYMLERLKALYPEATIINVVNSELSDEVTSSQQTICDHYGVCSILLKDIDKQWGHPSIKGMKAIANQIKPYIK